MIKYTNLLMAVAIGICIGIDNQYVFLVGRFMWGLSIGAFTVFVPKFITETAPTELKGPLGGLSQIMCCFGFLLPSLLSLAISKNASKGDFMWDNYWRVVWGVSIIFGILQLLLIQLFFNYETP